MRPVPLFSGMSEMLRDAYKDVGFPVEVQVWNPDTKQLETETIWLDGEPLPSSWCAGL